MSRLRRRAVRHAGIGPTTAETMAADGSMMVAYAWLLFSGDQARACLGRALYMSEFKDPDLRINTSASMLQALKQKDRTLLEFDGITAWVPVLPAEAQGPSPVIKNFTNRAKSQDAGDPEQGNVPHEKQILHGIQGRVEPGEMLALMGPSGSGKSSLLTVLGGRNSARISGNICFNGRPLDKSMKRKLGFVTQDDMLFAELTTFETLYYAALLRLPREWSRDQKVERVEMVLAGLGLTKARDTIIGDHFVRGVSGGERKRVSIGHELLTNPSVIFLDEPTSGLDSTTALKLVHTLRSLASGGRTVIASIHQPSSRLYQEFDKLMLLSEGHTMYYGHAEAAAHWFEQQGVPIPFAVSMPDHLLDLACGDLRSRSTTDSQAIQHRLITSWAERSIGTGVHGVQPEDFPGMQTQADHSAGSSTPCTPCGADWSEANESHAVIVHANLPGDDNLKGMTNPQGAVALELTATQPELDLLKDRAAGTQVQEAQLDTLKEHKWGATWFEQIRILISRTIRVRRIDALSIQRIAEILLPAVLAGLFWWQKGGKGTLSKDDATNLSGLLFFQVVFMGFSPLFQALFTFPADFGILIKERQSGMYRLSSYYIARTVSEIPMDCLVPTLFTWILYWMTGLRIQAGAFFLNWLTVILHVLVAQGHGLLISAAVSNPRTSMATATVLMLTFVLVSGFFVTGIPVWIKWLKYASFVYYSYNLLLKIEFKGRSYDCADFYADNMDAPAGQTWCSISEGDFLPVNVDKSPALEACMLIALLIVTRVVTYMVLNQRTKFKQ